MTMSVALPISAGCVPASTAHLPAGSRLGRSAASQTGQWGRTLQKPSAFLHNDLWGRLHLDAQLPPHPRDMPQIYSRSMGHALQPRPAAGEDEPVPQGARITAQSMNPSLAHGRPRQGHRDSDALHRHSSMRRSQSQPGFPAGQDD